MWSVKRRSLDQGFVDFFPLIPSRGSIEEDIGRKPFSPGPGFELKEFESWPELCICIKAQLLCFGGVRSGL
jgi:hypothetical protein